MRPAIPAREQPQAVIRGRSWPTSVRGRRLLSRRALRVPRGSPQPDSSGRPADAGHCAGRGLRALGPRAACTWCRGASRRSPWMWCCPRPAHGRPVPGRSCLQPTPRPSALPPGMTHAPSRGARGQVAALGGPGLPRPVPATSLAGFRRPRPLGPGKETGPVDRGCRELVPAMQVMLGGQLPSLRSRLLGQLSDKLHDQASNARAFQHSQGLRLIHPPMCGGHAATRRDQSRL